ncbi:hypothetical protein ACQ7HM_20565 [Williamsia sp. MIQD14]
MSNEDTARPLLQMIGDAVAGLCDPDDGMCALPAAAETASRTDDPDDRA